MANGEKERYNANSLVRGLEILKLFNGGRPTMSLAEIAKELNVSRTVPYRLLYTLQTLGYLHQDEHTKRYSLTPKVLELGFAYLNSLNLPEIIQPYLDTLRDTTGASCHLSILDDYEVVYIGSAPVRGVSAINVNIGLRLPAHATANGKLLLAMQPEGKLRETVYGSNLKPYTEKTQTDLPGFFEELETIRKNGYAISLGEFHQGIQSVAAPIYDRSGKVVAAINIVATDVTYQNDFIEKVALPKILDISKQLSGLVGN
ncbi:IclR family transcriptional regulator [Cytobacillus kochii]|uniref:IclR family transcriptional regulator n=1 Tax=Cytobacillus kochii TaxID=859143 RepID=UPI001CD40E0C|nr:IclR family transcriptional regulator [Cytobacillus kochii]MCA1025822.1 IclR family transcriptional regulator [Cytobacillus kochii]MCM3321578.1 IclR family transcriptional regulator [Cytobacillus kochii]MCM3343588.1 IclR family transcriptional regulator [Cytobacillus kochii]MDM5207419.1 IclR family transcriptional regulator [Cytobacillus kochii]